MTSPDPQRRWLVRTVLALIAGLAIGAGGALLIASREPGNVSHPGVEFHDEPSQTQAAAPRSEGKGAFDWPVYGYTKARTRYLPLSRPLRPPFAMRWKVSGSALLEFPPAMGRRSLFLLKNNGALYGITRKTGKVRWKRKLGYLAASSPAYAHNTVYAVLLERGKGVKKGRVVAVSAKDGRTRWSRKLPSRSESSPLVDRGSLYFGSEDGTVYALRARDGYVRWRYKAPGAVKAGLALDDGRLFFGDYSGHVQAVRASDGRLLWRQGTSGTKFGLGSGSFYSTPAAAFGRVYLGNTDGFVYSYAASSGKLAWRTKTGGYVYGSPAVAQIPGGRPSVWVGSYDGTFYCLDARSGAIRWKRKAEGRISGGAVLLGDLVFYSTLNHHTTALGAITGRRVWSIRRGAFNPVVSNGRGIFLVGYTNLYGFDGRPGEAGRGRAPVAPKLTPAQRRRIVGRRYARKEKARKRALARRIAARRRAVHRRLALRRRGVKFCYQSHRHGHRICRLPKPLVCFRPKPGAPMVCRPQVDGDRR